MLETPVAFFVFNRPDVTRRVFAAIRQARPRTFLVVADGPRPGKPADSSLCAEVRRIVEDVDWPCDVRRNYATANLGCGVRMASGIDWVFSQCEEAILLEDDCLPDATFFRFCAELLALYRSESRIAHIGGGNFQYGAVHGDGSYYFSSYAHCWGWATWRRAWRHYDYRMTAWPVATNMLPANAPGERSHWRFVMEETKAGRIDSWDYQWMLTCWCRGALSVVPQVNLISNIGFCDAATHTRGESKVAALALQPVRFPLRAPERMRPSFAADAATARIFYRAPGIRAYARRLLRALKESVL